MEENIYDYKKDPNALLLISAYNQSSLVRVYDYDGDSVLGYVTDILENGFILLAFKYSNVDKTDFNYYKKSLLFFSVATVETGMIVAEKEVILGIEKYISSVNEISIKYPDLAKNTSSINVPALFQEYFTSAIINSPSLFTADSIIDEEDSEE